jgi:peptidoglycan/xylan/chitin deacetylase (PgdA/CDA1 family)
MPGFHLSIDVENLSRSVERLEFELTFEKLLTKLNHSNVKATFFVLGQLAEMWKFKIREIQSQGHEIGLHGFSHTPIDVLGQARFERETMIGYATLSEILGEPVRGYRAPYFSLTEKTVWAPEILKTIGFSYSSSVLPAWNPQFSFPSAPKSPFIWPCGLIEFPVQSYGIGRLRIPILGGAYVRLAPEIIYRAIRNLTNTSKFVYTYCHPYDFDTQETFYRVEGGSWLFSKLLFMRRELMLKRIIEMVHPDQKTFASLAQDEEFKRTLKFFTPKTHYD